MSKPVMLGHAQNVVLPNNCISVWIKSVICTITHGKYRLNDRPKYGKNLA